MDNPQITFERWIAQTMQTIGIDTFEMNALPGDAGFRRYFRIVESTAEASETKRSWIGVVSPPALEKNQRFTSIARLLREHQIDATHVLAFHPAQGFLLCEDFGEVHLQDVLTTENVNTHYTNLFRTLARLYDLPSNPVQQLGAYDYDVLRHEMTLFETWFLTQFLEIDADHSLMDQAQIDQTLHAIAEQCANQPRVFVHRDFHCRNILVINGEQSYYGSYGVIDFQDALLGPYTYDLVSLIKDCYVVWSKEQVDQWVLTYYEHYLPKSVAKMVTAKCFYQDVQVMGLQRHIKVLGIFCRLYLRDGKSRYLANLPVVFNYVVQACAVQPAFQKFGEWLQTLQPLFLRRLHEICKSSGGF